LKHFIDAFNQLNQALNQLF